MKFLTLFQPGAGGTGRAVGKRGTAGLRKKLGMTNKQIKKAGTGKGTAASNARMNKLEIAAGRPAGMNAKGGIRKTLGK